VIVPLFADDPLNNRAEKALRSADDAIVVSDFSAAEFSSVIARRVRTRELRPESARAAFSNFDSWCARNTEMIVIDQIDILVATSLMRRLDLSLRTPDAIHIAIIQRIDCNLLTFDRMMAIAARSVGIEVVTN
jgi:predicted nucleic acid-binding protein